MSFQCIRVGGVPFSHEGVNMVSKVGAGSSREFVFVMSTERSWDVLKSGRDPDGLVNLRGGHIRTTDDFHLHRRLFLCSKVWFQSRIEEVPGTPEELSTCVGNSPQNSYLVWLVTLTFYVVHNSVGDTTRVKDSLPTGGENEQIFCLHCLSRSQVSCYWRNGRIRLLDER